MTNQQETDGAEIAERMEMLLLSADADSVLLGLELAMNPAIARGQLTLVLALYLFHRSARVQELGGRVFAHLAGPGLRDHVARNWEPTHLKGHPDVYYNAIKAVGQHPDLEENRLIKLAVRLRRRAPETVAQHFPQAFLEWARIYVVNDEFLPLSGYRFPYLPGSLAELSFLRVLEANNCGLRRLPQSLTALLDLQILDVSDNLLRELPDFLADLPQLEQIKWGGNPVRHFPPVLARMPRLKSLELDLRHLRSLEGLETCQQVEWLKMKYGRMETLPEEVMKLKRLQGLTARKAGLKTLPDSMVDLKRLEDLDLEENSFAEMPSVLGELTSLQFLSLGEVRSIGSVEKLAKLNKLSRLTMAPMFKEWPAGWCMLPRLRTLRLKDGRLESLPLAFSQLIELHSLDLSNNRFTEFPEALQHVDLMDLNLHGNRISQVPDFIQDMTSLSVLDLSHNPLKELPEAIFNMKRLVRLELQNTQLPLAQIKRLTEELPNTRVRFS